MWCVDWREVSDTDTHKATAAISMPMAMALQITTAKKKNRQKYTVLWCLYFSLHLRISLRCCSIYWPPPNYSLISLSSFVTCIFFSSILSLFRLYADNPDLLFSLPSTPPQTICRMYVSLIVVVAVFFTFTFSLFDCGFIFHSHSFAYQCRWWFRITICFWSYSSTSRNSIYSHYVKHWLLKSGKATEQREKKTKRSVWRTEKYTMRETSCVCRSSSQNIL